MRTAQLHHELQMLPAQLKHLAELRETIRHLATHTSENTAMRLRLINANFSRIDQRLRTIAAELLEDADL